MIKPVAACLLLMFFSTVTTGYSQSIRDRPFKDIDGHTIDLASFAGKKLLFIILPTSNTDTLVAQLKSFVAANGSKVQVIGVLSQEDGYTPDRKATIKAAYRNTGILITDVMGSRKGNGQSTLMKWLTDRKENGHFDMDVKGPGHKFFVNSKGKLYAVFGPETPLSAPFLDRVVNATETGEEPVPVRGQSKSSKH